MPPWTPQDMPSQSGKTIFITGANSGLGYWSSLHLARAGAHVIMACRSAEKMEQARQKILQEVPRIQPSQLEGVLLDLSDLESITTVAKRYVAEQRPIHTLLNNAGVMALPYQTTAQGFERQFGTNHLGHFALTAQLFPLLKISPSARVVTISSLYHRRGHIDFDNLQGQKHYQKWQAYAQSKLANLLFTLELQRRLDQHRLPILSLGAHPGYAATNLQAAGAKAENGWLKQKVVELANRFVAQPAEQGAYPQLFAATEPGLSGGLFFGPDGFQALRGHPTRETPAESAQDLKVAQRLWETSEKLTGCTFLSTTEEPVTPP